MRSLLALSLVLASIAILPPAAASCDPIVGALCQTSHQEGTCERGEASNDVTFEHEVAGASTDASARTYCFGYPGYFEVTGVEAAAASCDGEGRCASADLFWQGGHFFGSEYCTSELRVQAVGAQDSRDPGLCEAGAPPAVDAIGLP